MSEIIPKIKYGAWSRDRTPMKKSKPVHNLKPLLTFLKVVKNQYGPWRCIQLLLGKAEVRSQHLRIETISTGRWLDRVTRLSQVSESKSSGACGRKISKDISKLEQTVKPHCCRSDKLLCVTFHFVLVLLEEWIHFPSPCPGKDVYNHWNHRRTAVSQLAIETCVFLSTFKTAVGQCEAACVLCEIMFTLRVNLGGVCFRDFYYRLPADSDLLFRHPR